MFNTVIYFNDEKIILSKSVVINSSITILILNILLNEKEYTLKNNLCSCQEQNC